MREVASGLAVFALLCASAGLGLFVQPHLPERHRSRETVELMQLSIGLLVTFAALVLGLLTASVKQGYDNTAHDWQQYALRLSLLDQCLGDYGPDGAKPRMDLHSYAAAVLASTWPDEPPPTGVRYPDVSHMPRVGASPELGELLDRIGLELTRLTPADGPQAKIAASCTDRYKEVQQGRLSLIEDAGTKLFDPFYVVLVFWLMIIFVLFGLVAPRNMSSMIAIALCAISLGSVIFVIADLSMPYEGLFSISSTAMRGAVASMLGTTG